VGRRWDRVNASGSRSSKNAKDLRSKDGVSEGGDKDGADVNGDGGEANGGGGYEDTLYYENMLATQDGAGPHPKKAWYNGILTFMGDSAKKANVFRCSSFTQSEVHCNLWRAVGKDCHAQRPHVA
jgi:hypothetical protein